MTCGPPPVIPMSTREDTQIIRMDQDTFVYNSNATYTCDVIDSQPIRFDDGTTSTTLTCSQHGQWLPAHVTCGRKNIILRYNCNIHKDVECSLCKTNFIPPVAITGNGLNGFQVLTKCSIIHS